MINLVKIPHSGHMTEERLLNKEIKINPQSLPTHSP